MLTTCPTLLIALGLIYCGIGPNNRSKVGISGRGVPAGYLAGGMVAGVFLLADLLRQNFTRRKDVVAANFWDEEN